MLANFLDKTKPIIFVVLVSFFFLVLLAKLFIVSEIPNWNGNLLLRLGGNMILYAAIFFFYNFINGKNNLTYDNAYAFFLFIGFSTVIIEDLLNTSISSIMLLQLLFLRKIYSLKSSKNLLKKLFDAGFWLAFLCFFEPGFLLFYLLILIAIFLHQKMTIFTLGAPLLGFLAPAILIFTYHFWNNSLAYFSQFGLSLYSWSITYYLNQKIGILVGVLLGLTVISYIFKSPFNLAFKNTFRKNWLLLLFHLALSIAIIALLPSQTDYEIMYLLFPTTIIIANGVELIEKSLFRSLFVVGIMSFLLIYSFAL